MKPLRIGKLLLNPVDVDRATVLGLGLKPDRLDLEVNSWERWVDLLLPRLVDKAHNDPYWEVQGLLKQAPELPPWDPAEFPEWVLRQDLLWGESQEVQRLKAALRGDPPEPIVDREFLNDLHSLAMQKELDEVMQEQTLSDWYLTLVPQDHLLRP